MYRWNEDIQKIINWIEDNLTQNPSLLEMSKQIGYSPYYCSSKFHYIVGMSIKSYLAKRRLCEATLKLRDTDMPIIKIALDYGFSSQQSFTRAFVQAFSYTPFAYRNNSKPIPLSLKKDILFPEYYYQKGDLTMSKTILTNANVKVEFIPAHKYIFIKDINVQDYFSLWKKYDCDKITGIIESMNKHMHPIISAHTAGWITKNGQRGYTYGIGVDLNYAKDIPEKFEVIKYPDSYYLVFYHPSFDFLKDCDEVVANVENMAWNFNPESLGFLWNEEQCQDYQRLIAETIGYEVLRPVTKL